MLHQEGLDNMHLEVMVIRTPLPGQLIVHWIQIEHMRLHRYLQILMHLHRTPSDHQRCCQCLTLQHIIYSHLGQHFHHCMSKDIHHLCFNMSETYSHMVMRCQGPEMPQSLEVYLTMDLSIRKRKWCSLMCFLLRCRTGRLIPVCHQVVQKILSQDLSEHGRVSWGYRADYLNESRDYSCDWNGHNDWSTKQERKRMEKGGHKVKRQKRQEFW